MDDTLQDHSWNKQNPRWLRATVWAAQHAAWGWSFSGQVPDGLRRCAACAAEIPEDQARSRCSKCKLIFFCDRECQLAAHPLHKHNCTQPEYRKYAISLKVLHDNALTERDAPAEGCMVPPSYAKLVSMIDQGYPSGQIGGPRSTASTAEQYQAASAAYWIAKYNLEKNVPGKVWQYSMVAANIAKNLRYYQLRSDALRDQVSLLQYHTSDSPFGPSRLEQCDDILQIADQYEDIHLQALANGIRASLMKQKGLSGSKPYLDRCKECLLDMMKASKLRGKAGELGLALSAALLIMTLLEAAWVLLGKSSSKHQQAEQFLREAQQYTRYAPTCKLQVLAALADNCELASFGGGEMLERAAEFRQELFVEMIDQNVDVPKRCAVCCKKINGHKASLNEAGQKAKIMVAACGHLCHKGCLQRLQEHEGCPVCRKPLMLLLRAIKSAG